MPNNIQTVPNQRVLTINKQPTDREHKYTCNNLESLRQAARNLQSKGGFKLYMYLAKNQDKYHFALSSTDFIEWSGMGITAYNSAFKELVQKGYLVPKDATKEKETIYTFYDLSEMDLDEENKVIVENIKDKVDEIRDLKREFAEMF